MDVHLIKDDDGHCIAQIFKRSLNKNLSLALVDYASYFVYEKTSLNFYLANMRVVVSFFPDQVKCSCGKEHNECEHINYARLLYQLRQGNLEQYLQDNTIYKILYAPYHFAELFSTIENTINEIFISGLNAINQDVKDSLKALYLQCSAQDLLFLEHSFKQVLALIWDNATLAYKDNLHFDTQTLYHHLSYILNCIELIRKIKKREDLVSLLALDSDFEQLYARMNLIGLGYYIYYHNESKITKYMFLDEASNNLYSIKGVENSKFATDDGLFTYSFSLANASHSAFEAYNVIVKNGIIKNSSKSDYANLIVGSDVKYQAKIKSIALDNFQALIDYVYKAQKVNYKLDAQQLFTQHDLSIVGKTKGYDYFLKDNENSDIYVVRYQNLVQKSADMLFLQDDRQEVMAFYLEGDNKYVDINEHTNVTEQVVYAVVRCIVSLGRIKSYYLCSLVFKQ